MVSDAARQLSRARGWLSRTALDLGSRRAVSVEIASSAATVNVAERPVDWTVNPYNTDPALARFVGQSPPRGQDGVVSVVVTRGEVYHHPALGEVVLASTGQALDPVTQVYGVRPGQLRAVVRKSRQPVHVDAVALALSGPGAVTNQFHLLVDALPRLLLLRRQGLLDHGVSILLPGPESPRVVQAVETLGLGDLPRLWSASNPWIRADTLLGVSGPRPQTAVPSWVVEVVQTSLKNEGHSPTADGPRRIYIRRGDAPSRRVLNEEQVEERLVREGFVGINLSTHSVSDQVRLFAGADVVVGAHGAGLTNCLFVRPGTRVIEFVNSGWGGTMFQEISGWAGARYSWISADTGQGVGRRSRHRHFAIPSEAVDVALSDL